MTYCTGRPQLSPQVLQSDECRAHLRAVPARRGGAVICWGLPPVDFKPQPFPRHSTGVARGVSGRDTEMRTGAIGTMVTDSLHTGELTCGGSASFDPSQDPNPSMPTTRKEQPPPSSSVFLMSHPPEPPSPTPRGNTHLLRVPREHSRLVPCHKSILTYLPP